MAVNRGGGFHPPRQSPRSGWGRADEIRRHGCHLLLLLLSASPLVRGAALQPARRIDAAPEMTNKTHRDADPDPVSRASLPAAQGDRRANRCRSFCGVRARDGARKPQVDIRLGNPGRRTGSQDGRERGRGCHRSEEENPRTRGVVAGSSRNAVIQRMESAGGSHARDRGSLQKWRKQWSR